MRLKFNNTWIFALLAVVLVLMDTVIVTSCSSGDTYASQKKREREAIQTFLTRDVYVCVYDTSGKVMDTLAHIGKINVITEEQFCDPNGRDTSTNLENNEYVQFSDGVYLQIIRRGTGEAIKDGQTKQILCRFWEYNIMGDSVQLDNFLQSKNVSPEHLSISNTSGVFSGTLVTSVQSGSMLYNYYGDTSVPSGWLKAFKYIKVGRQTKAYNPLQIPDSTHIAKVRMIIPHSMGQSHASSNVYPCLYEMTFQQAQ